MTIICYEFSSAGHRSALDRFSARLKNTPYKDWPLRHHWNGLPGDDGADFPVRRRRLLSLDAAGEVRALQNHFEHELYVDGKPHSFVWPNGSLSESVVDPRFAPYGVMLLKHALRLEPLQMALAFLALDAAPGSLFRRLGWSHTQVPVFILPIRLSRVLRELRPFRYEAVRLAARIVSGVKVPDMAWSAFTAKRLRMAGQNVQEVPDIGDWADPVWNHCRDAYKVLTRRDAATMNRLYSPHDKRLTRLRVRRNDGDVGWAIVCDHRMHGDSLYGSLHVGCVVDALGMPEHAPDLLRAAVNHLIQCGVDLVVSHWSHAAFQQAARYLGFARRHTSLKLFVSKAGKDLLLTEKTQLEACHFSVGDCDGPVAYLPEGDEGEER